MPITYTPTGGQVKIIAQSNEHHVTMSVEDTGSGIPVAEQDLVFDRFYRVDSSRNREKGGFGLGLAITKQIVHLHQGSIQVNSKIGKGTQIVIHLPISP